MDEPQQPINLHEELARLRKAVRLADVFDAWQATAETARDLDEVGWASAAALAETTFPSGPTKDLVVDLLRQRQKLRDLLRPASV